MPSAPILVVAGTNRPNSNALRIANLIVGFHREAGTAAELFSLGELPPEAFLPTSYAEKPPAVKAIQKRVLDAAGLHLVVPEYNGSFPGVLKYFVDLLKFPESFDRKPVAFVGEAAGLWGGLRAVEQLQMVFAYRNAHVFPPRVFIPGVNGKLDADGNLTDDELRKRLSDQAAGFARFASQVKTS